MREKAKLSWSKTLVKKWFNNKSKAGDFHDADVIYGDVDEEWSNNLSEMEACTIKRSKSETLNRQNFHQRSKIDLNPFQITDVHNYRIFVATWNVGGKSPSSSLKLEEWLHTSPPADIYVLGFQEIVPLNAGNVLGAEDNGPARKWQALIRKTLNNLPIVDDFEMSNNEKGSSFFHRSSFHSLRDSMRMAKNDISIAQPRLDSRFSACERVILGHRPSDEFCCFDQNVRWDGSSDDEYGPFDSPGRSRYCLVASKQMVGIFLTVWIKSDLRDDVQDMKVSCVGRGLMGYLGNKLQMEQREGRVFPGWNEGKIRFPPTYKYSNNSDKYAGENMHPKEKRRTPAWCDRILWHGRGLKQLSYVRGESRFSDHRPVYSVFLAEVESVTRSRLKKSTSYSSSRVEVEELLAYPRGFGQLNLF
ncbi:hypothetical protein BUALT_Bualt13G0014200 [Buddleja alternifolia]|uniref:Inositol polyphosphate-related phosphatase domain-containing protein n=1 Tax=Buddleja alternifolia TaxID=168488 RepID=A0AAV6WUP7_9LAMI|nr:hypothetical protein BUALT_Bualt13G0014200 [Buddleja alternifolia]